MPKGLKSLNVGIIGAGAMGRSHANAAARYGSRIVGVHDVRVKAAQALAAEFDAHATDDLADLFDRNLDLVVIATPPAVRLEPIRMACQRRVHLLIEKPPALTVREARECLEHIEKAGVLAAVGFQLRYGAAFEKLRDMLAGQTVHLVRTLLTTNQFLDSTTPSWYLQKRHSGGPIAEQAVHPLDVVRYVLGDARCVQAHALAVKNMALDRTELDSENAIQVTYELDNGVFGTHMNHCGCEAGVLDFEFIGPHLRLTSSGWGNGRIKGQMNGKEVSERVGDENRLGLDKTGAMLRAVETGDASLIRSPFRDALHTVELIEAANRSKQSGKFVRVKELGAGVPSVSADNPIRT